MKSVHLYKSWAFGWRYWLENFRLMEQNLEREKCFGFYFTGLLNVIIYSIIVTFNFSKLMNYSMQKEKNVYVYSTKPLNFIFYFVSFMAHSLASLFMLVDLEATFVLCVFIQKSSV